MYELCILIVVVDHHVQVLVDGEDANSLQVGQHVEEHALQFLTWRESVVVQVVDVFFLKLLDGHEHGKSVQQHLYPSCGNGCEIGSLEGLAQVGGHRYAALHNVGLVNERPVLIRRVEHRKREGVPPDTYDHLLVLYLLHLAAKVLIFL